MNLSVLKGNETLKEQLSQQEQGRGLSHTYILSGPAGSGRHTLARLLAAGMLCLSSGEHPCGNCGPCGKVMRGIHPDVSVISGEGKKPIAVDQVRALRTDAYIRPNEGERKIYLLEGADQMNTSSQNAMLKLLEEGPPYAVFFLLTENAGGLLQTVRSRCEELSAGQETEGRTPDRRIRLLAQVLVSGTEEELFQASMELDRVKKEELIPLLEDLEGELGSRLSQTPSPRLVKGLELVRELRQAARLNVNQGQLAGWLCAGMFL